MATRTSHKSSKIRILPTGTTKKALVEYNLLFHDQVAKIMLDLLTMRGVPYVLRDKDGEHEITATQIREAQWKLINSGRDSGDCIRLSQSIIDMMAQIYGGIMETGNPTKYRANLYLKKTNSGNEIGQGRSSASFMLFKDVSRGLSRPEFTRQIKDKNGKIKKPFAWATEERLMELYDAVRNDEMQPIEVEAERKSLEPDVTMENLVKLRKVGILPLPLPGGHLYQGRGLGKLLAMPFDAAVGRLKSHYQANLAAVEARAALDKVVADKKDNVPAPLYALFLEFAEECRQNGFGVSKRFAKKLHGLNIPKTDFEPGDPFIVGLEIIKQYKYRPLWPQIGTLAGVYLAGVKAEKTKGYAAITIADAYRSPALIRFGITNYARFEAEVNDQQGIDFSLQIPVDDQWTTVTVSGMPSNYFQNPELIRQTSNYALSFTKGNRQQRRMGVILKEPLLTVRYSSDPEQEPRFYVHLAYNYDKTSYRMIGLDKIRAFFSSNLSKGAKLPHGTPYGLRTLSIDLGIRPIISSHLMELVSPHDIEAAQESRNGIEPIEVPDMGFARLVDSREMGGVWNSGLVGRMIDASRRCKSARHMILVSKLMRDGKPLNTHQQFLIEKYVKMYGVFLPPDDWARKDIIGEFIRQILADYRVIKDTMAKRNHPDHKGKFPDIICSDVFRMLFLIKDVISMLKSWARYKRKTGDKEIQGQNPTELNQYWRYYNNLKDDLLKKIVHSLVRYADEHGVHLLLLEDITGNRDSTKHRKENSMFAIWSPTLIRTRLEEEFEACGMLVQAINPSFTSQTHYMTGEFGFRDPRQKECLYFKREGRLYLIDSDGNSSMGLQVRFWTRHRDLWTLKTVKARRDRAAKLLKLDPKRAECTFVAKPTFEYAKSYLKRNLASPVAAFVPDDNGNFILHKLGVNAANQLTEGQERGETFFRHGTDWITHASHKKRMSAIEAMVEKVKKKGDKMTEADLVRLKV